MTRWILSASLLLGAAGYAQAARAAPDAAVADGSEAAQARITALEARIASLEAELQSIKQALDLSRASGQTPVDSASPEATLDDGASPFAEFAASPAPAARAVATPVASAAGAGGTVSSAKNTFNPAINLILNGSFSTHSLDPENYRRAGFPLVGEGGPGAEGFSLGETELSLAANIDDKFYGQVTLAVGSEDGEDEIGIEEAYIDTTALPNGFSVRAGRFFSNIGYLNSRHAHTDLFSDRPLPYQAFLGNQYGDDGAQLRWVAPTALFLELGGELFRGASFPAGGAARKGVGTSSLFAHVGGDVGVENSWLFGLSQLRTRADPAEDGFSGDGRLLIADATWKWAPHGNFKDGGVTLRGEYFRESRDGEWVEPDDPASTALWDGRREGAYLEGTYRFNRRWDAGYRYDRLWSSVPGAVGTNFDPARHSLQLTWRNSEFSLMRLQLTHDTPDDGVTDNTATLQYQTSLGAHGAHKF